MRVPDESSNDESPTKALETSKQPSETCPETGVIATVLPKDICAGSYVLVQLLALATNLINFAMWVVCQSDIDEDEEIRVQFLKTVDGKCFTEIVKNIAEVRFEDILLEAPDIKIEGKNIFTEFSKNIDWFEKK